MEYTIKLNDGVNLITKDLNTAIKRFLELDKNKSFKIELIKK